ncbi:methyl-accepting chemotaxis protein [Pseudoflavonifractor sp. 524-17]|uniref:methyl-accepting chemotaxis protein n=1 Tax=Pseudoflavonifractor sp. 524-17 TaxID=2304577 RepID=UPI00137B3046|nr:methyl-accepting chemotaxis protein [Pseudoflavonifractor sp. 524-17]NCE65517.1 methyl-accepting chemotaxis protein [Pseudoflavonifractor sp. 524-17]
MLKNMKLRTSLIFGFGSTLLISLVIVICTLFMLNSQSSNYQRIINGEVRATQLITECRLNANIAARTVRNMALSPGDPGNADLKAKCNQALADLDVNVRELREVYPLNDTRINDFINALEDWAAVLPEIQDAIDNNRGEEAVTLIRETCTPRLNTMASISEELSSALTNEENKTIKEQARNVTIIIILVVVLVVFATAYILLMSARIIRSIAQPVAQVRAALIGFSEGNFDVTVDFESKNELGDMSKALRTSQKVLDEVISDVCHLLEEMGNGNFNCRTKDESMYVGELSAVLKSIRVINRNLSDTLSQINLSAEQVSAGAEQVSTGAQALAQGATEQASAVEELSATIAEIANNSRKNAQNSEEATTHTQNAGQSLAESSEHMQKMVAAMEKISESSAEIAKIIDTIENIAFQTNILALNAAVEAARAGSAGKGFAVVADEVRNLASKSDQAAKATKDLIDRSINSVKDGNDIVKRVSDSLEDTSQRASLVVSAIQEISKAAEEESEAIAQVTEGIDQISSVVQTNSATSEESAAASEELSSQAALMKELMARFTLRSDSSSYGKPSQAPYKPVYESPAAAEVVDNSIDPAASSAFSKY